MKQRSIQSGRNDMKITRAALVVVGSMALFSVVFSQQLPSRASNGQLEGWFNLAMQWGGTIQGVNSKYTEGATIPLRFTATLPSGTSHMVLLKFDFSNGGDQRFFDSLGSYDATVKNVNPTAGFSGLGPAQQKSILPDATLRPETRP